MWDPFRYKLGGKLLNSEMRGIRRGLCDAGQRSDGTLRADARSCHLRDHQGGRSRPRQSPPAARISASSMCLRPRSAEAFGPVVDRLADQRHRSRRKRPVEVAPIAHYHMGGIRVDEMMATGVPGLYACGEAVGGANGANRLSGNAITEAFVFGARGRPQRRGARKAERVDVVSRCGDSRQSICCAVPANAVRQIPAAVIAEAAGRDGRRCRSVPHRCEIAVRRYQPSRN